MPRNLHVVVRLQAYPDIGGNTRRSLDSQNCFGGNGAFPVSETKISPLQIPQFLWTFRLDGKQTVQTRLLLLSTFAIVGCRRRLASPKPLRLNRPRTSSRRYSAQTGLCLVSARHNQSKLCFCSRLSLSLSICSYVLLPGRTMPSGIEAPKHNR